ALPDAVGRDRGARSRAAGRARRAVDRPGRRRIPGRLAAGSPARSTIWLMGELRLGAFTDRHVQHLRELVAVPALRRFTRPPVAVPQGLERTWFDLSEQGRRSGTREAFVIVDGGEVLGIAAVPRIDAEAQTVELGYVVAPAARGRGVATAALRLLTD